MEGAALPGNPREIIDCRIVVPLLTTVKSGTIRRSQNARNQIYRNDYSQSGGMEAIASSEPQARFFFAGVRPGLAWLRIQRPSLLVR